MTGIADAGGNSCPVLAPSASIAFMRGRSHRINRAS